jgi:hypothetical protein
MAVRLDDRNPLNNSEVLQTIEGVEGYFSEFSGVKWTVERPDWGDGLTNIKRKASGGTINYDDVTLGKAFDPEKDDALITWCESAKCALETFDITIRPVKRCDGIEQRGTKAWRLSGARLKEFTTFESMDTNDGGSVVMIKLAFTIEQAEWA